MKNTVGLWCKGIPHKVLRTFETIFYWKNCKTLGIFKFQYGFEQIQSIWQCTFLPCLALPSKSHYRILISRMILQSPHHLDKKTTSNHRGMNTRGENCLLWKGPTFCHFICLFCHNLWTNYDLNLFSTSEWWSELQFCERCLCRWQNIG